MATSTDPSTPTRVLIIGAGGQLGTELAPTLAQQVGDENVILSDLRPLDTPYQSLELDVLDAEALEHTITTYGITQIYHLAAILSAKAEQNPKRAWHINMDGLMHVLDLAVKHRLDKVYWPSSIAVFGPMTPKTATQYCERDPETIYGITKQAGERLCAWYQKTHGLDVRSLRYPGLISWKASAGGGTTDYAVEVFEYLKRDEAFTCFLRPDSALPMMYMPDAVRATLELMNAPQESLSVKGAYNVGALSFTPEELFGVIRAQAPELETDYAPDYRQAIADTWPDAIDDQQARTDWGWQPHYDLHKMVTDILANLFPERVVKNTENA